ncbi:ATP-dependent DNA helicase Pif1-like [Ascaphus truei]|uniref:ATP-dependent DNA helicase Pif1-like n=1 Tax=Ascaphus truei TaxID=8439 RepID=UPI003F59AD32
MSEDILAKAQRENPSLNLHFSPEIFNEVLILIEDTCLSINNKTLLQLGLQAPQRHHHDVLNTDLLREKQYNISLLQQYVATRKPMLIAQQLITYENIMNHINNGQGAILFLDAPGGTGKTFLINLLLAEIRMHNDVALALASSGIAATLMDGGRTVHSALKLPLNIAHEENPTCNITKTSGQARVLQICKLIVWDECTMAHKKALEALNRTLQDLRNNKQIMGGAVILLAGDFRQTLPVIPRSTPADELHACLKSSILWRHVKHFPLTTNMRVQLLGHSNDQAFADTLLQIGEGTLPTDFTSGEITFPIHFCHMMTSLEELIHHVYPNLLNNYTNHQWLWERAILAAKNTSVNSLNYLIQDILPHTITQYNSIDTVVDTDEAVNYPTEFLHSLEPSGMPPHHLYLKVGAPIMLLRNLHTPNLCNGTRLCIKTLMPNLIEATILTGNAKGQDVYIPRIPLIPTDIPFTFKRLQFPIRLAFAITINKAQGQSIKCTGINLESPCFSHGQLYVACSRVGSPKELYIFAPTGTTKNVVYKQALQ